MRLSPSFRAETVFGGVRRDGDDDADDEGDGGSRTEPDAQRPDDETVTLHEDEKRERPHETPQRGRPGARRHSSETSAMASISTLAPFGSAPTSRALRAGGSSSKYAA